MGEVALYEGIDLFENFWQAGMRKVNKKAARKIFQRLIKEQSNPHEFVLMLCKDIYKRNQLQQFGFDAMHPTTYLNGERWEDEYPQPQKQLNKSSLPSFAELHRDLSW